MSRKPGGYGKEFALYSSVAVALPACVAAGFLVGRWLDGWWGTDPAMTVVCILLGAGIGFHQMYVILFKRK